MQEETFGPILPITTFQELEEAVNIANSTPYGLDAYFFINDYMFNRTGTVCYSITFQSTSVGKRTTALKQLIPFKEFYR